MHAQLYSGSSYLVFGMNIHPLPYFVSVSSEGSSKDAEVCPSIRYSHMPRMTHLSEYRSEFQKYFLTIALNFMGYFSISVF